MTLEELAEDTMVHLLRQPGVVRIDRGDLVFSATGNSANVQRVRLGDVGDAVRWARDAAVENGARRLEWWVGWNATPADLGERLLGAGLEPDDEEATLTGMTLETPPPEAPGVDVRRIETIEEQLAALTVDWDVWGHDEAERARRAETEHRRFDPNGTVHHFAAYDGGRPVGFGRAVDMDGGSRSSAAPCCPSTAAAACTAPSSALGGITPSPAARRSSSCRPATCPSRCCAASASARTASFASTWIRQ